MLNAGVSRKVTHALRHSLQDWNYLAGDCMELTLELSQLKWPQPEQLPKLFQDNLPAMLAYPLAGAFGGVWCAAYSKFLVCHFWVLENQSLWQRRNDWNICA
jgi:hypothetical protein